MDVYWSCLLSIKKQCPPVGAAAAISICTRSPKPQLQAPPREDCRSYLDLFREAAQIVVLGAVLGEYVAVVWCKVIAYCITRSPDQLAIFVVCAACVDNNF